jgi:cephalosporin hydroxylase
VTGDAADLHAADLGMLGTARVRLIVDDGLHTAESQLAVLAHLWPLLDAGGVYVVEDVTEGSLLQREPNRATAAARGAPAFFVGRKSNQLVLFKRPLRTFREAWAW